MADFCITFVKVREEKQGKVGAPRTVSRAFVADLIRLGKVTFQTRTKTNERWQQGAAVYLIDDEYLTTERNDTKRDNLGELPTF